VLFNPAELFNLDRIRNGMARSTFLRSLSNNAAHGNGKAPPPARESRHCRGVGRPASRAGGAKGGARRNL
jgi:hypothetical protein